MILFNQRGNGCRLSNSFVMSNFTVCREKPCNPVVIKVVIKLLIKQLLLSYQDRHPVGASCTEIVGESYNEKKVPRILR